MYNCIRIFTMFPKFNLSNGRSARYRFTDLIVQQNKSMISKSLRVSFPLLCNYVNYLGTTSLIRLTFNRKEIFRIKRDFSFHFTSRYRIGCRSTLGQLAINASVVRYQSIFLCFCSIDVIKGCIKIRASRIFVGSFARNVQHFVWYSRMKLGGNPSAAAEEFNAPID